MARVRIPWLRLSLAANAIFVVLALALVARRMAAARADTRARVHAAERLTIFAALPQREGGAVLLGDSLTERGEWAELLGDPAIRNRGVAGDTTAEVLARLPEIVAMKPERVFLMVGVNDLAAGEPIAEIAQRYHAIVQGLHRGVPEARLFCLGVLPVRDAEVTKPLRNDGTIALDAIIRRFMPGDGCTYLDVRSEVTGADGQLDVRFTLDGLHLNGAGYAAWAGVIAPYLHAPR